MTRIHCFSFVEDEPSKEALRKLVAQRNESCRHQIFFQDGHPQVTGGFARIREKIPAFLNMAKAGLVTLALTDLDMAKCAPSLIRKWFSISHRSPIDLPAEVVFRVAVREVEAWLLADRGALARFLEIPELNFSNVPEDLPAPKRHLLEIIARKGRKKWQQEMLPQSPTASIGPEYNRKLSEFIRTRWDPHRAARTSGSLARTIEALRRL